MSNKLWRYLKYKFLMILRLPDSAAKIALGVALGIAFNFLPTFGTGLVFAFILASIIGANRAAAVISAIAVKVGIPFFYLSNLVTGHLILNDKVNVGGETVPDFSWSELSLETIQHLGKPFLIGSAVNALVAGLLTYYLALKFIEKYKMRRMKRSRQEGK